MCSNCEVHDMNGDLPDEEDSRFLIEAMGSLPDATLAIDTEGKVRVWNRAMEKLTGISATSMMGKGNYEYALPFYGMRRPILVDLVLLPEDQLEDRYDFIQKEGDTLTVEIFIPTFGPNGTYLWAKASPLHDPSGNLLGAVESIRDITEKKKAEEKIFSMKKRLAEVIDFLPDATFAIDAEGRVITWNRAMEKMTGALAEDMIGKGNYEYALPFYGVRRPILADLILMQDEQQEREYRSLQKEGRTLVGEIFIPTFGPEGSFIWAKATPLYDIDGKVVGAIESIRDITERKKTEEELLRSEQEKAAILGGLKNVAVEYLDPAMRIIWVNDAVQRFCKKSLEELRGMYCYEVIQGLDRPCPGCKAAKTLADGSSQEGELVTPDGRIWAARSSAVRDAEGEISGAVHVAVNITEIKLAEKKVCSMKQRLAQIIDFLPDATFAIDENGKVTTWNRAMEKMTGALAEDMIGKGNYEYALPFYGVRRPILADLVLMPEDQLVGKYDFIRKDGKTLTVEIFIPTFGSSGAYLWAKATPIYDSNGNVAGAIESIRDITDRKIAEERIAGMKQRLSDVIDFLPDATFVIDKEGRVVTWNKALERMTGALAEDMIGRGNHEHSLPFYGTRRPALADLVLLPDEHIEEKYSNLKRDGRALVGEVFIPTFGPEGSHIWVKATPLYDSKGKIVGAIESIRDITDRKVAEERIAGMKQRLSDVIDFLPDATFAIDKEGRVITWNKAIEKMTGVHGRDIIGKGNYEYALPFYGIRRPILADLVLLSDEEIEKKYPGLNRDGGGKALTAEIFIPTFGPTGSFIWAKATPLYDSYGNIMGAIESIRDITEMRRAEETLERNKSELRIASDIQRSFLPERIPPIAGFDLAAISVPAMEVGGDFYDFIPGEGGRLGMVIADVSGKSVPAALFMALSRTIVRANATHHESGTEVLQDANDMISADSRSGMFVTLFYGVLDEETHDLIYANAGHPPPLLFRRLFGDFVELEVTGIALGILCEMEYDERRIALSQGDVLILYTDGVTEATNSDIEQYGMDRLRSVVRRAHLLPAQKIMECILEDISSFSGDQAQFDDITMVVVKAE